MLAAKFQITYGEMRRAELRRKIHTAPEKSVGRFLFGVMPPFSPIRFSAYARDLAGAVYELSREHRQMSIDRIRAKLQQAAGVAQRVVADIEAEADAVIAEEAAIRKQKEEAFAPHRAVLAESRTELQAVKDALNLMSNGGPALDPLRDAEPSEQVAEVGPTKYPRFA